MGRFRRGVWILAKPVLALLVVLHPPTFVAGQEPVSLEHVVALARQRAPAIAAARARVVQAEGRKFLVSVPPDPALTWGTARAEPRDGGQSGRESGLELEQFLPSPRSTRAWSRSGNADIEASREEVEAVTADVVLEVKRLYYEGAVSEAQARALSEAAKDAQSLHDIVRRRVELGEASEGDRLRTRVEALRADFEARGSRAEAEASRAALNRFLLGELGENFSFGTELDPTRLGPPPETLTSVALERSPDYRAAQRRIEAARWALSAERSSRVPGLAVSLFRDKELDKRSTGLTLGLTVPLWNRNQGGVRAAEGELAELEAEALELRAAIEADLERLVRRERAARETAISYRREILPAAAEALSIVRFSLEQGEANLLAWLESRRSYLEVLRASHQAHLEAFLRRAELARLTGVIDAQ